MANPQIEDGYTPIANEIAEALMKINLSAYESRVLWFLFRKTYGWQKKTDRIALSQFTKEIGLDRRLIHRAIKGLSSKKMIVIYKDDTFSVSYGFQKDYDKWELSSKKMTVIDSATKLSSKEIPTKETIQKKKEYTSDFLLFWNLYPKKTGSKKVAFENWKKLNGEKPEIGVILDAIKSQIVWREKSNGEFRPEWKDPERWIKGKMWEVELDKPEVKSSW